MIPHAPCMQCQWYRMHHACGVNDTTCILKKFDYVREFEFIFEKALAPQSGAQDGCFGLKTEGQKSRETVPLTILIDQFCILWEVQIGTGTATIQFHWVNVCVVSPAPSVWLVSYVFSSVAEPEPQHFGGAEAEKRYAVAAPAAAMFWIWIFVQKPCWRKRKERY
jgi:hypothetical protein